MTYSTSASGSFVSGNCTEPPCYNPNISTTATEGWGTDTSDDSDDDEVSKRPHPGPHKHDGWNATKYTDEFATSDGSLVRIGFQVATNKTFGSQGVLGLSPSNKRGNPNYIDILYAANRIQQKLVSWSFVPQESAASLAAGIGKKNDTTTNTTIKFGSSIPDAGTGDLIPLNATGNTWMFNDTTLSVVNGT